MPPRSDDDIGSLEKARERLYEPDAGSHTRSPLSASDHSSLPHAWETRPLQSIPYREKRHVRLAGVFFVVAFTFFLISLLAAGYFFYFGGNSVSVDKITVSIQGPTTIAGGDIVPLSLTITNRNPVPIKNATVEIDFPDGTLSADGSLSPYPRHSENLGELGSGATVTRSIKAIVFGGAGQALALPVSFSYGTGNSSTVFLKKSSYALAVSSSPLSVSVDTTSETVSGKPLTLTLVARSNANVPLDNVILAGVFPFGFSVTSSSEPMNGPNFVLGTLQPGASKTVTLTGTLTGQNSEQRVFHFTIGTAKSESDQTPAVAYMTQDVSVTITAPFITTTLALNGDARPNPVVSPGSIQSVTVSYTNTLSTSVTNAAVAIAIKGSAVDYGSIRTTNGFYRSSDHTVVFNSDTDSSLAALAPGASGIGAFTFSTVPANALIAAPSATFTISVSGTRVGQTNVPEEISAVETKTMKVATAIALSASALHSSGPLSNSGPIPPRADQATTYTVQWNVSSRGNAVAGGLVSATLPSYVSYTGRTSGVGTFSYDDASRTVSWSIGDLAQGATGQGAFQVSLTPSDSQKGSAPQLTGVASFKGYDRFAGVQISATADPVTTDTPQDSGYSPTNAAVQ
ncbi:TPA: hypothetical protein DIV48_00865 [Candidatus Kaiserbacteria bacterium]|nr:MAG: hypothetical protein UY93_C0004G0025 [Parcubacteria group bacterium GW2011_GWA1_56_13]KKW47047.1 MAG: hypothetical protein UY97_C0001G0104 [Parcubacteria group bacterium GW2011_GWB1_57_6]HCR52183.1 hypothetical protein [Candidatus Kaiserbacteria bacterium]